MSEIPAKLGLVSGEDAVPGSSMDVFLSSPPSLAVSPGPLPICLPSPPRLVPRSCLTVCDPMDCRPPGSSAYGILQVSIVEWVAISFSKGKQY